MKLKMGSVSSYLEIRAWNTGGALYSEIDWKAMPIRPGKTPLDKAEEYWAAAPNVCEHAYDVESEHFCGTQNKKAPHTVCPPMVTSSVYISPFTEEPLEPP